MARSIKLKRVYEPAAKSDGHRILVDRLWPRGLSKQKARVDVWLRDIAPSTGLRKWYGHDPERWPEFRRRYAKELKSRPEAVQELRTLLKAHATVTLLFSSKEEQLNNAAALKAYLRK